MYRQGCSCLRYEFDPEQMKSALLHGGGACELFKGHGVLADPFDLHGIPGDGSQIGEQGAEAALKTCRV